MNSTNYWDILNKYLDDGKKKNSKVTVVMLAPPTNNGFYTGKGADGVVQANKPAGVDYGTNPPSVYHEDEFVRKGQNGQLLQVQPSPVTMAKSESEQQQIAKQQNLNDWPGYQTGFDINKFRTDFDITKKVKTNTGDSENSTSGTTISPFGSKYVSPLVPPVAGPAAPGNTKIAPQSSVGLRPVGLNTGGIAPNVVGAGMGGGTGERARPQTSVGIRPVAQPTDTTQPTEPAATDPTTGVSYVRPPAMWETGAQEGYAGIRDVARGQSEAADLAREKSMDYLAGTSAGQLGAAQQQWLSAGVSPETMAALSQQAMRSQDITRGGVMKDLAISEAERAEGAQKDLISGATSLQALENAKYQLDTLKRTTEGTRLAAVLQGHFDAGTDWKSDPNVRAAAQAAWEANGFSGPVTDEWIATQNSIANVNDIDVAMRNMEGSEWFTSLPKDEQDVMRRGFIALAGVGALGGVKVSEDAEGNLVFTNSEGDVVYSTGTATGTSGDKPVSELAEDATVISEYLGGEVITPTNVKEFNSSFGRGMANEDDVEYLDAFKEWFKTEEEDTSVQDYIKGETTVADAKTLKTLGGMTPPDWSATPDDPQSSQWNVSIILAKDRTGKLTDEQRQDIIEATGAADYESAMDIMLEPTGMTYKEYNDNYQMMDENAETLTIANNKKVEDTSSWYPVSEVNNMHYRVTYPTSIYDVEYNDPQVTGTATLPDVLKFNADTLTWADENKGKIVEIDGKKYFLDPETPVLLGGHVETRSNHVGDEWTGDTVTDDLTMDALNLVDVETGMRIKWVPDVTFRITEE